MVYLKKIFVTILAFSCAVIFISFNELKSSAVESKIYSAATIEDNFANDRILIVLDRATSVSDKIYSAEDFETYGCIRVKDLTIEATSAIQNNTDNEMVNTENYKRVLSLTLETKSKENVLTTINELMKREDVLYAGPDYQISASSTTPNDSFIENQWAINDLGLKQTWDYSVGTGEVIVGIMDSGIDGTHPELSSRLLRSLCRDFTSGTEVAVSNPTDPTGHGTHVAGIIGGFGSNHTGISGVNWEVCLVSLRVFDENGYGSVSYVGDAICYAQTKGIKILNFSGGSNKDLPYNDVAFDTLIETYSGLLICAAGNFHADNDGDNPNYPSSYESPNILAVGAYNSSHNRCDFSNYGANSVDIYAPGENILSTFSEEICEDKIIFDDGTRLCELDSSIRFRLSNLVYIGVYSWNYIKSNFERIIGNPIEDYVVTEHYTDGYHYMDGTSMATPYATGVAALLMSVDPDLTPMQLKYAIINGSESMTITIPSGATQSVKRLNAYKTFKYVLSSSASHLNLKYGNKYIDKTIDGTSSYFIEKNAMIRLEVQSEYDYDFKVSATRHIDVTLYDYNLNIISTYTSYYNENFEVEFSKHLSLGGYYLKISYVNETKRGTISVDIYGPPHTHTYDNWVYYSKFEHIEVCDCRAIGTITRAHMVRSSEIINNKVNCLECGHLLDLNIDIAMIIKNNNNIKYSINGSYILPSGIVVLMDEDIDAYFAGTLIFYKKDEIPQLG